MPKHIQPKHFKKSSGRAQKITETPPKSRAVRGRREEPPRWSKTSLNTVLDAVPCMALILRRDLTILYFSRFAELVTGYARQEVLGKNYLEVFIPEEAIRKSARKSLKKLFAGTASRTPTQGFELPLRGKDGSQYWAVWHGKFLADYGGETAALGIGCDITDRKQMEQELRGNAITLRTVLDAAPCMIVILRQDRTLAYFNPYAEKITGYTATEVVGKDYFEIFVPDEAIRKGIRQDMKKVAGGLPTRGYENPVWCKEGYERWFVWNSQFLPEYEGEPAVLGIGLDITERKGVAQALQQSEERLRLLLDSTAEGIIGIDVTGNCTFVNRACLRLLRYDEAGQVLGKNLHRLVHHTRLDGTPCPVEECPLFRAFRQGEGTHADGEVIWRSDGTCFPVEYWSYPVRHGSEVVGAVVTFVDITERKQAEEALRSSEARTRALLEAMPDWMFRLNKEGVYLDFHAERSSDLAMPPEAIIGTNIRNTPLPPHVIEQSLDTIREALETGTIQHFEYRLLLNDVRRDYETRIVKSGEEEVVAIVRDITQRKQTQESLRRMSKVFMDAADPIIIVDLEGRILDVNEEAVRTYGWSREELLGQSLKILLPTERLPYFGERLVRCKREGTIRNEEGVRRNKNGERLPVLMTYSLLTDEAGKPEAIATIAKDISELKRAQERLQQLTAGLISSQEETTKALARELHDAFSQKLAVFGMELSAVNELLPEPSASIRERLQWMEAEISRLAKDVHQLSRRLHPSIVHDLGLTTALRAECAAFSGQHGLPVEFLPESVPESLPEDVSLCLYRVAQESLRNISQHAVARQARVTLSGTDDGVRLRVEDSGSGFDPKEIRGKGGLGLTSMEERVRLVSGSFSVQSQKGQGTIVEVRIPLAHQNRSER